MKEKIFILDKRYIFSRGMLFLTSVIISGASAIDKYSVYILTKLFTVLAGYNDGNAHFFRLTKLFTWFSEIWRLRKL